VSAGDEPKGGDRLVEARHRHHVVTNAMGVKVPAVRARRTGDPADREASRTAIEVLDRYHGQVTGVFSGDEHFGGREPSRGTETCSVVEYMYCLERLLATLGDAAFGDRLERVGYNALPAAFTPDMCAHQYDQQVNQVLVTETERPWTNGADANLFGVDHFCCTTNCHQGWPKLAASLWMRDGDGLAAVAYAPCEVTTEVGGTDVTLREETAYPYGETVAVTVEPETPATFPLQFRVPAWTDGATVSHPDGEEEATGEYHELRREWQSGDEVEISLPAPVETVGRGDGAALRRGPLVFSLPVPAEETHLGVPHTRVPPDGGVELRHRTRHRRTRRRGRAGTAHHARDRAGVAPGRGAPRPRVGHRRQLGGPRPRRPRPRGTAGDAPARPLRLYDAPGDGVPGPVAGFLRSGRSAQPCIQIPAQRPRGCPRVTTRPTRSNRPTTTR
jgi:DUF1680 family protein